jgi:hypothetical protein
MRNSVNTVPSSIHFLTLLFALNVFILFYVFVSFQERFSWKT